MFTKLMIILNELENIEPLIFLNFFLSKPKNINLLIFKRKIYKIVSKKKKV